MVALDRDLSGLPQSNTADAIPVTARRRGASPRQVLAVAVIGTLVLAVLAAGDLPSWSQRLDGGRFDAPIQDLCRDWADAMTRIGLTRPHRAMQQAMNWLLDQRW